MVFNYTAAIREMKAFAEDLRSFVAPESLRLLHYLAAPLESARDTKAPSEAFTWRFGGRSEQEYLRTVPSNDGMERANTYLSFGFWFECKQGVRVKKTCESFEIQSGSVAFVLNDADNRCAHRFSIDFQEASGPGSQFHVQCKGNFENISPFTDLPRLLIPTGFPIESISLVLHEVFPSTWAEKQARSTRAAIHGAAQRERITTVLEHWLAAIATSHDPVGSIRKLRMA